MRAATAGVIAAGVIAGGLLAGCGGEAGDLIALEGTGGSKPGHRVVVTGDGRGSCDGGDLSSIPSDRLIDAREVERELEELADESATFPEQRGRRRYTARTDEGIVRWSEGARELPRVLPEASLLALQLERELCR
jgi:hypothetical protein